MLWILTDIQSDSDRVISKVHWKYPLSKKRINRYLKLKRDSAMCKRKVEEDGRAFKIKTEQDERSYQESAGGTRYETHGEKCGFSPCLAVVCIFCVQAKWICWLKLVNNT